MNWYKKAEDNINNIDNLKFKDTLEESDYQATQSDKIINIYDHKIGKSKNIPLKQYYKEYKGLSSEIVQMTPNEYLELCVKENWKKEKNSEYLKNKNYEYYKNIYLKGRTDNTDLINSYAERWRGGSSPPLCYIKYFNGQFSAQEGIHRMLAAIKLGAGNKKFPVMIIYEVKNR